MIFFKPKITKDEKILYLSLFIDGLLLFKLDIKHSIAHNNIYEDKYDCWNHLAKTFCICHKMVQVFQEGCKGGCEVNG